MSKQKKVVLPLFIAALGGVCMFAGVYRGELKILFAKATNICLECIGIG